MGAKKKQKTAEWIGGAIGFTLYMVFGVVPSLLFGGKVGVDIVHSIAGVDGEKTLWSDGGMLLGFAVGLLCFVLLGAIMARGISYLLYCDMRINAERAANSGQLHPLPPDTSAPSTSQDPKS